MRSGALWNAKSPFCAVELFFFFPQRVREPVCQQAAHVFPCTLLHAGDALCTVLAAFAAGHGGRQVHAAGAGAGRNSTTREIKRVSGAEMAERKPLKTKRKRDGKACTEKTKKRGEQTTHEVPTRERGAV